MIRVTEYATRTVAVMGLARSGLAAVRALVAGGATVLAWDDAADRRKAAATLGARIEDLATADWRGIAALVLSPGVPHSFPVPHPVPSAARGAGVPIICDIELLLRARPEPRLVAITGTNGKSTTTALIGHVLAQAGVPVEVGGNIGRAALNLEPLGDDGVYVLELSSYQLELVPSLAPSVAVLLNITPDHLDRHGGFEGYVAAKRAIFRCRRDGAVAVVGIDDETCGGIARELEEAGRAVVRISGEHAIAGGIGSSGGHLMDRRDGGCRPVLAMAEAPALPGSHNAQNAAAALATATLLGVAPAQAAEGIRSFPGLAHRQEQVGTIDGVRYVNDSKATNADAAARALACYDAIYWIAGGLAKAGGIESLAPLFPRIRRAFLIGDATEAFAATLGDKVPFEICGTLDRATEAARRAATADGAEGAVVLLSPACASFDQFASFEARGDAFRDAVRRLAAPERACA